MGATTLTPLRDYLQASYRPDREYIDGRVLERNLGEKDHSRLQMLLSDYLYSQEGEWGITVFPEQRVQVAGAIVERLRGEEADRIVESGVDLLAGRQTILRLRHQVGRVLQREQVLPNAGGKSDVRGHCDNLSGLKSYLLAIDLTLIEQISVRVSRKLA